MSYGLNSPIIMIGWPLVYGAYMPVALREGGTVRLWEDAKSLALILVVVCIMQPSVYIYYASPLMASGFDTYTLPLSVLASAYTAECIAPLSSRLAVQILGSCIAALVIAVSSSWIA